MMKNDVYMVKLKRKAIIEMMSVYEAMYGPDDIQKTEEQRAKIISSITAAKTVGAVVAVMRNNAFDAPQCMSVLLRAADVKGFAMDGAPMHYDT